MAGWTGQLRLAVSFVTVFPPLFSLSPSRGKDGVRFNNLIYKGQANENIRFKELPYSKFRFGTYSNSRPKRILKAKASSAKIKTPQARL